jgi:ATP-dependent exoDNAse (exonuclease V) beta subunit
MTHSGLHVARRRLIQVELDDVYETERQLLYVACTRARDRLMVSGISPGSEFLADLSNPT